MPTQVVVRSALAAVAAGLVVFGCNAILGFDKADLDTTLGDAGDGGGGGQVSCDQYCQTVMGACTGVNAEYTSGAVCQSICGLLEPGFVGGAPADTVACRQTHALMASGDPATECPKAGPLGIGDCQPDPCQSYCQLDLALCADAGNPPYTDITQCRMQCPGYPYLPDAGDIAKTNGNTLNCRIYHLESAYAGGMLVGVHCPHTGQVSATCN
jgi:hypothetical protein